MGPGSVSAGIHAGLRRSGKGEGVLIDKAGQEGVLREGPQQEKQGRPSRVAGSPERSWTPGPSTQRLSASKPTGAASSLFGAAATRLACRPFSLPRLLS